jgi:hypothetical protein
MSGRATKDNLRRVAHVLCADLMAPVVGKRGSLLRQEECYSEAKT